MIDTGGFLDFYDRQVQPNGSGGSGFAAPIEFYENRPVPGEDYIPFIPPENTGMPSPEEYFRREGRLPGDPFPGTNPPPPPPQRSPGRPLPPGNIQDMLERMRDKFGRTPRRGPMPDKGPIYQPMPRPPRPPGRPPIDLGPPFRLPPELPRFPSPEPEQPSRGGIGDLFRPYGSGLQDSPYGNLMDSIAEYGAGYNPYSQMGDFLMNRPVFDRGERPGSPMDMFRGPAAGGGGLFEEAVGQMQQQAPAIQQQYEDYQSQMEEQRQAEEAARAAEAEAKAAAQAEADAAMQARFDELNQRLADQEAAAAAREQEYRTSGESEREQLLARIAELEGAKPDLDAIRESIRADVMSNLPSQPSFDAEAIAKQVRDSMGLGDLNIADINERVAALQQSQADLAGKAQAAPQIDIDALRAQIQEGLNVPNVDVDAIRQQIQSEFQVPDLGNIQERLAQVEGRGTALDPEVLERIRNLETRKGPDLSGLENRIKELQGRIPEQIDVDAIRRQVQEGIELPNMDQLREDLARAQQGGRGTVMDPDVLARISALEERKGPDLSGIEQRIKELQERGMPDLSGLQERLAMIENQRARDAKGARTPARGPGVDKKGPKVFTPVPTVPPPPPKKMPPLRPIMRGGFGI